MFRRIKLYKYHNCLWGLASIEWLIHKVEYFVIVVKANGLVRNTYVVKVFFICFRSNDFSYKSKYVMLSVLLLKITQNNSILLKQESVLNGENIHGLIKTTPESNREFLTYKKSMKYIILTKIINKMKYSDSSLAYLIPSADGLLGMKNWGWEVSFSKSPWCSVGSFIMSLLFLNQLVHIYFLLCHYSVKFIVDKLPYAM